MRYVELSLSHMRHNLRDEIQRQNHQLGTARRLGYARSEHIPIDSRHDATSNVSCHMGDTKNTGKGHRDREFPSENSSPLL